MRKSFIVALINGDCRDSMSDSDLDILETNFEHYKWDGFNTFKMDIHVDLNDIFHAWHRIPDQYQMNTRKQKVHDLTNYLPLITIETLSYFDYFGEKIYGCIKQEPMDAEEEEFEEEYEENEYEIASASDMNKLMNGVLKYLEANTIGENHDIIKTQVEKMELLTRIASPHYFDIIIFNEDI